MDSPQTGAGEGVVVCCAREQLFACMACWLPGEEASLLSCVLAGSSWVSRSCRWHGVLGESGVKMASVGAVRAWGIVWPSHGNLNELVILRNSRGIRGWRQASGYWACAVGLVGVASKEWVIMADMGLDSKEWAWVEGNGLKRCKGTEWAMVSCSFTLNTLRYFGSHLFHKCRIGAKLIFSENRLPYLSNHIWFIF